MFPIITKLGGRRFALTLLGFTIFTTVLCFRLIDQATYATLVTLIAGGYFTSNTVQKVRSDG